jgi:CHAT domain-containing protein
LLLAAVLGTVATAQGQFTDEERAVLAMASQMAAAPNRIDWLDRNAFRLTAQTAALASRLGQRAVNEGELRTAEALYTFAGFAYLSVDQRSTALASFARGLQARFLAADTPEQYRSIRSEALALILMAESTDATTAFDFSVIAADSAFFAGVPADGQSPSGVWVVSVLQDVVAALQRAGADRSLDTFERLVSLTHAIVTLASHQPFSEQERIDALLADVAASAQSFIPVDFAYRTAAGNDDKTRGTAMELAELSYRHGRAADASARLVFVADRARRLGNLEGYLATIHLRYRGERRTGTAPALLRELRTAARSVAPDIRRGYRSRAGRIWNSNESEIRYREMLADEAAEEGTGSIASLFDAVESSKARTLLDEIGNKPVAVPAVLQPRASQLERTIVGFAQGTPSESVLAEEIKLASQLSDFTTFSNGDERERSLRVLEQLHRDNGLGFSGVTPPASLRAVQAALDPSEALIEYAVSYDYRPGYRIVILVITRSSAMHVYVNKENVESEWRGTMRVSVDGGAPLDLSVLSEQVVSLRTELRTSDEKAARVRLSAFYDLLIQPLVERGFRPEQYARIIVVPNGVLHYVPFLALMDRDGVPLIRKTAITMAPSASVWFELQRRAGAVARWVGFGNPVLSQSGLASLESSAREVQRISALVDRLEPRIELGANATRERFLTDAPTASILHLATHGELPDDDALDQHGILLARGPGDDGIVRAADIRRLDLSSLRLAVLSVCNGGLFRLGPADEPYGLVPAFFVGGAQNVAATLWKTDDQFARQFMVEFYSHLLEVGPAEALRRAALRFIDEDVPVRQWAGFVMVGPGRPFDSSGR